MGQHQSQSQNQSESNTITKPYSIKINKSNESTNYIEWTNFKNLKKGEKYRILIESYEFELIFCYYLFDSKYGYCENCDAIFKDNKNYYTTDNYFEYYKIISKKEYNLKMREKYNEKVLNIVLKQIVNDDFKW
jgi:uncharacterized C2H2 Zn-finger protein